MQQEEDGTQQPRARGFYNPGHNAALSCFGEAPGRPEALAEAAEPQHNPAHPSLAMPPTTTRYKQTGLQDIGVSSVRQDAECISPQSLNLHSDPQYTNTTVVSDQHLWSSFGCFLDDPNLAVSFPGDQSYQLPSATVDTSATELSVYDDSSTSVTSGDDVLELNIAALHGSRDGVLPSTQIGSLQSHHPLQTVIEAGPTRTLLTRSQHPTGNSSAHPAGPHIARANRSNDETISDPRKDTRLLTCPYVWYDPAAHRECLRYRLKRIRDVKQHLQRKHMKPSFCANCKAVFVNENKLRHHLEQAEPCVMRMSNEPEGLTPGQRNCLAKYPKEKNDVVAQWNTIWSVVFPNHPELRPYSPFMDENRPEAIMSLIAFFQKQFRSILMRDERTRPIVEDVLYGAFLGIGAWEEAMRPGQPHVPIQVLPSDLEQNLGYGQMAQTSTIQEEDFILNAEQSSWVTPANNFSWSDNTWEM